MTCGNMCVVECMSDCLENCTFISSYPANFPEAENNKYYESDISMESVLKDLEPK